MPPHIEFNRRSFLRWCNLGLASWLAAPVRLAGQIRSAPHAAPPPGKDQPSPETILLKDYRPRSIYKVPTTKIAKAKFPVIDMHSHPYAKTPQQIDEWVRNMDEVGVQKTIILTMATGAQFDDLYHKYSKHRDRFEVWCGFEFAGYDKPGFGRTALKELERCRELGACGVGEIHDKGKGLRSGKSDAPGMHPDDPRMDSLWEKLGELGMPVSLHVADPIWMYQKMDRTNDGLMNAYYWRLDNQPNIVDLQGMINIL